MKISIISVTENGRLLSKIIFDHLKSDNTVKRFCFKKHGDEFAEIFSDIYKLTEEIFEVSDALIFICSCGIAVRSISPAVKSKLCDPAVLVIDDSGKYVIPILSGHIGGANQLAEAAAEKIGAIPVITTATDVRGKFSPDMFAKANGLIIADMNAAKEIAAAALDNETIGIRTDYPYKNLPPEISEDTSCRTGICVSGDDSQKPFDITLNLVPKNIVVGIGCKKGTSCEKIEEHISKTFAESEIDINRICAVSTIDIKSEEAGLLEYCRKNNFGFHTYTAAELMQAEGDFIRSDFVTEKTGADNVCERSAVLCSGGSLIIRKTAGNGITAAAAEIPITLDFERNIK